MRVMSFFVTSLREDVAKDVLRILYESNSVSGERFKNILNTLTSKSMYEGKEESLKMTLYRILKKYEKEGVIERIEKNRKNVSYRISDQGKVQGILYPQSDINKKIKKVLRQEAKNQNNFSEINNFLPSVINNYLDLLTLGEIRLSKAIYEGDEKEFRHLKNSIQFLLSCYWEEFSEQLWRYSKDVRNNYKKNLIDLEPKIMKQSELNDLIKKPDVLVKKSIMLEIKNLQHELTIIDAVRDQISCAIDLLKKVKEKKLSINYNLVKIDEDYAKDLAIMEEKTLSQIQKEFKEIKKQMN